MGLRRIGCKSTIKIGINKKIQTNMICLDFFCSIPSLAGICMLMVTFDEFETQAGVV